MRPIRANFEITNKCNLRCRHCYFYSKTSAALLSEQDVFSVLNQLIEAGILELSIGGGEPFCFEKLQKFLKTATQHMYTIVSTNGLMLNQATINQLSALPNFSLQISLDGNEQNHRLIRNLNKNQYHNLIRTIKYAANRLDLQIGFMLCHLNTNDLEDVIRFCIDRNIHRIAILPYIGENKEFSLDESDISATETIVNKFKNNIAIYIRDPELSRRVFANEALCEAGKSTYNIDPDGNISACTYFPSKVGTVFDTNLEQVANIFERQNSGICRGKCLAKNI